MMARLTVTMMRITVAIFAVIAWQKVVVRRWADGPILDGVVASAVGIPSVLLVLALAVALHAIAPRLVAFAWMGAPDLAVRAHSGDAG